MKRDVGLCVLGLLCLQSWVLLGQDLEDEPEVLVFCDNPAVNEVAKAAMTSFNDRVLTGNKMALYQILSASKAENASGVVYSIKFNSRKSDCPAGDAMPWTDCGYLADDVKEPRPCNATVYVSEGSTSTLLVECSLEGPVQKERAFCMGCPEVLDLDSEDLKVPLAVSISKYNSNSNFTHLFMLNSVGYATRQVVAGLRYHLYFDLRKSTCSKAEHTNLHPACTHADDVELANCISTVDIAEWRHEVPQANLNCGQGPMLPEGFNRRRPPGWSPLRNLVDNAEVQTTVTPFISLDPSILPQPVPVDDAPPAKDDSSEEEDSTKVREDPFHCPSKPWKKFIPTQPTAADPAPTDATTDPVDGALTDLDLLG
ncbi:unnamed protein product [Lota lota]